MILDTLTAREEFLSLCPADVCPMLTEPEITTILAGTKRASVWQASHAYGTGDIVIPTSRTGHRYIVTTGGTSGATEPSWSKERDATVVGGTVTWEENGYDWNGILWDITGAARKGWLLKASKASPTADTVVGEMQIKSSQLFDHCRAQAESFRSAFVL